MVNFEIYIEGAETDAQRALFRKALREFFTAAGVKRRPGTFPSGSRNATYKNFVDAMEKRKSNDLPLLLVDSEEAVASGQTAWQHLKTRDGWDRPEGVTDDQAFLMVQVIETWLLADVDALKEYFGSKFDNHSIPAWPDLESVDKQNIFNALKKATSKCKRPYSKGEDSFELVGKIRPSKVENASCHAKFLLDRIRNP